MAKFNKITKYLPYLIIIIVSGFILTRNINKPFIGHHDWNGVFYANIARNYLNHGFLKTKLGQATISGQQTTDKFNFYTHYPPLFPLTLSLSYFIFNISEISTRLIPILFTLGYLLILYHLARKLKFSPVASLASTAIIFTPMLRYFGKMPSQEAPIVFFTTLSLLFYLDFLDKPNSKNKLKLFLATFLNGLTGWAGYFIYPLLVIHSFIFHRRHVKTIAKTIIILFLTFGLHLLHTYILTDSVIGGGLIDALLLRLNFYGFLGKPDPSMRQFTWPKYLVQQARWLTIYYTRTLILSAFIFLSSVFFKFVKKQKISLAGTIIFLLFLFGLSYPIIFSNVVFIHEYFNIFFVPFFALSFAWLIHQISQKNHLIAIITATIPSVFIFTERLPFYQALEVTRAHELGYQLGNLINQTVPQNESAVIFASSRYLSNHDVFIKYYADRKISFVIYNQSDLIKAQQQLFPINKHIFTYTADQPVDLFVDASLATQSAIISKNNQFNYYYLK